MTGDQQDLELRSYGRRRGRKRSPRQEALLRDVLPKVAVDLAVPGQDLFGLADGPARELWLEIGFGGGEHLLWQARENSSVTLIGCEPFEDGAVKVLDQIERDRIANIRLHVGDARDVLRWLPEASVARAFILFPDPWPKRKQQKRRLINAHLLSMLARVLQPRAQLRIGTDIGDYARSLLEAFEGEPRFRWLAKGPADWRLRPSDWPETRYEAKAEREGRRRYYFRFERI